MKRLPGAIFIVDPHRERIAVTEANKLEIPVVGTGDTNVDPDELDYIIPANDDAIRAIRLLCTLVADAAIEGARERATRAGEPSPRSSSRRRCPSPTTRSERDRRARGGPRRRRGAHLRARSDDEDLLPGDRSPGAEAAVAEPPARPIARGDRRRAGPRSGREGRGRHRGADPGRQSPTDQSDRGAGHTDGPARGRDARTNRNRSTTTMADISAELVKELRERTGAGFMDCKRALDEADGDLDKATALLRERGLAAAAKKAGRDAREGLVSSYIHTGGRVGVLIEVNCETDFVARTDEFQKLVRDLAIQVAGLAPQYVDRASVPAEDLEAKRAELLADESRAEEAREHPRPDRRGPAQEVVRAGRACYDQPFRDEERTVGDLITERDRDDRREHPGPPLRPLRARGGPVSDAARRPAATASTPRPTRGAVRYRRILLKLSGEALLGDRPYGVDPAFCAFIAQPGRRGPRPRRRRSASSSAAATSSAAWPRRRGAWTARPATTSACSRPS